MGGTTEAAAGLRTGSRGFREVRRLAHECAEAVAARLEPGVTERAAARVQRAWLRERGVRDWFRPPFARFGDRTAPHPVQHRPAAGLTAHREGWSPPGSPYRFSDHLPRAGLWAQQSAFWLDDDLPHVRRWAEET
ncbi:M24 family metallopeptidase [Streptomyces sp. NPDC021969]|uniref:M24 family metallopeptidase n=1 Tax=unclassified Streptomyces TaxID=2593676 RepID=UPI0034005479